MDREHFWQIIEVSRTRARGDQDAQAQALYQLLQSLPAEEVVSFDEHFRLCMRAANRTDFLAAATILDGFWVSTDAFQDFRSWLVASGREVYEAALRDPDNLADSVEPEEDCYFEAFCYIAGRVWEEKTGQNRQHMYGGSPPPGQSTGAEGEKWEDEAALERRFPRLWAKFPQA